MSRRQQPPQGPSLFDWAPAPEPDPPPDDPPPGEPEEPDEPQRGGSLDQRFQRYHKLHPQVYQLFREFALQLWAAGRRRAGAKQIFERIRWELAIKPDPRESGEGFKLNNIFTSRYARLLVAERPELAEFFEFRKLKSRATS